jgi:hypothetical protein
MVLYAPVRQHGCPEVLVSDSGAIFLAKQAQAIYHSLDIEKSKLLKNKPGRI